jgi:hypothetical protein
MPVERRGKIGRTGKTQFFSYCQDAQVALRKHALCRLYAGLPHVLEDSFVFMKVKGEGKALLVGSQGVCNISQRKINAQVVVDIALGGVDQRTIGIDGLHGCLGIAGLRCG